MHPIKSSLSVIVSLADEKKCAIKLIQPETTSKTKFKKSAVLCACIEAQKAFKVFIFN
jgi:hypothetical protein